MKKGNDNEIVRLHGEGESFREIGRRLDLSHVAVRKRYLRAAKVTSHTSHKNNAEGDVNPIKPVIQGNPRKPDMLTNAHISEVHKSKLPEVTKPRVDGNLSGNPTEDGSSQSSRACATEGQKYSKKQRYLRNKGTDTIWIWTPFIAPLDHLEEVS